MTDYCFFLCFPPWQESFLQGEFNILANAVTMLPHQEREFVGLTDFLTLFIFSRLHQVTPPIMKFSTYIALALVAPTLTMADEAAKAKLMEAGKAGFMTCAACHGMDGQGVAAGPKKMAPSLSGSKIVNGDPALFALVVHNGIAKETQDYLGMMAPLGAALDDEKLASVMTYVRNSFNNTSSVVTPADVKKYREQFKDITGPVTRAKLEELGKAAKK